MCSYVFMKLLESSEKRYDKGINLLTLGNTRRVKEEIASKYIKENDKVIEIGVGTGTLTILCAQKGAQVTGIDVSKKMLELAEKKINEENCIGCTLCIQVCPRGVYQMDTTKHRAIIIKAEDCVNCSACVHQCPTKCLTIK